MNMSVGNYLKTRFTSLKPPMTPLPNPFSLLAMLNTQQWLFFGVAFAGWTWDAFDFFTVSLTVSQLAAQFKVSTYDITWGITLVLMFRSVGSIIFGIAADRYGRKWPVSRKSILTLEQALTIPSMLLTSFSSSFLSSAQVFATLTINFSLFVPYMVLPWVDSMEMQLLPQSKTVQLRLAVSSLECFSKDMHLATSWPLPLLVDLLTPLLMAGGLCSVRKTSLSQ